MKWHQANLPLKNLDLSKYSRKFATLTQFSYELLLILLCSVSLSKLLSLHLSPERTGSTQYNNLGSHAEFYVIRIWTVRLQCNSFHNSSYFVVDPKPPFRISVTLSSAVIPYSTKIPCINPCPFSTVRVLSCFASFVIFANICPSLSE